MQIQFQLSLDDYCAAQRLHSTRSSWSRINYVLNFYLSPVLGLCFLALGFWLKRNPGSMEFILIVCGLLLILCPLYMRIYMKRCYKRTRTGTGECAVTLDEERILIEAKHMKSELDWSAVQSFREDGKVFMLYLAPAKFVAIPKRACTKVQIAELRAILPQKVPPAAAQ